MSQIRKESKEKDVNPSTEMPTTTQVSPSADSSRRFENPSYFHGTQDQITGSVKESIGKLIGNEGLEDRGKFQKQKGQREIINAKCGNDKYDELNIYEKDVFSHMLEKISENSISLFDYVKYLEIIPDLTYIVECWLIYQLDFLNEGATNLNHDEHLNQLDDDKILLLKETLFHLFIRKVKNCRELHIQSNLLDASLFNVRLFKVIRPNYLNLSSLHIIFTFQDMNESKEELFHNFISLVTKDCHNIKELKITTIDFSYNAALQGLIEILIKNQRNLKCLSLSYPNDNLLNYISKIIKSKKHTLTSMHLENIINN
ncbi:277_t:CDS:2, partial [Funneliformis caledonium]